MSLTFSYVHLFIFLFRQSGHWNALLCKINLNWSGKKFSNFLRLLVSPSFFRPPFRTLSWVATFRLDKRGHKTWLDRKKNLINQNTRYILRKLLGTALFWFSKSKQRQSLSNKNIFGLIMVFLSYFKILSSLKQKSAVPSSFLGMCLVKCSALLHYSMPKCILTWNISAQLTWMCKWGPWDG